MLETNTGSQVMNKWPEYCQDMWGGGSEGGDTTEDDDNEFKNIKLQHYSHTWNIKKSMILQIET